MKYSFVVATLVATAYAAALPGTAEPDQDEARALGLSEFSISSVGTTQAPTAQGTTQAPTAQGTTQAPTAQGTTQAPTERPTESERETTERETTERETTERETTARHTNGDYPTEDDYPTHRRTNGDYPTERGNGGKNTDYSKNNDYGKGKNTGYGKKYEEEEKTYIKKYFEPRDRECYEDKKARGGYKPVKPEPKHYDVKKSYYGKLKFPLNLHVSRECNLEWQPKVYSGKWEKKDRTKAIYFVDCDDYTKKWPVCNGNCGDGYQKWTVPEDCDASDKKDKRYRFEYRKEDCDECITYSEEIVVYSAPLVVNAKEVEDCPEPVPVPDCPAPPTLPPTQEVSEDKAPAKVYPSGEQSAKSPVGGESTDSQKSIGDYGAPASNMTAFDGAGSVARASVSVIVGVAALVTFVL